ncbi:MAG: hypothetical protein Q7S31_04130 [bacterium]|nr:hypothetical protein [bacterium]
MPKTKPKLNSEQLRARLKLKELAARKQLENRHPHIKALLTGGVLAGSLLVASPQSDHTLAALPPASEVRSVSAPDIQDTLSAQLKDILPSSVQQLEPHQEDRVSQLLHQQFGLHATPVLEGNRLNRDYGYIGLEQHLPRFPGDNRPNTTPGRGAWGYFAPSRAALTPDLVEKERYYVAVQTLYLPDWTTRLAYLRDWYKYRKVVLVNPKNGKAIVAVVADSGPAAFTGKSFGGSPEVMEYLNMKDGKQKGPVVLFFVDDPANEVPLGPLEYNLERQIKLT